MNPTTPEELANLELIVTIDAEGVVTPTRPGWEGVYEESESGEITLKIIPPKREPAEIAVTRAAD